jgi:hypothetical protein
MGMLTRTRARAVDAAATAGLAATCTVVASGRIGRWGATGEELNGPLPGDDEVPEPAGFLDVGDLHPGPGSRYLAVVGPDGWSRVGWYSYDLIDNDRIPSAQQIIPEFQALQAADFVPEGAEAGWTGQCARGRSPVAARYSRANEGGGLG